MNQRSSLRSQFKSPSVPFLQLPLRSRLWVVWQMFRLHIQLLFSHRFLWFVLGLTAWLTLLYVINYREPMPSRMQTENAFMLVMQFPLSVLAILLSMQIITSEKEKRTLEVMFTTAGSRYKIWLARFGSLHLLLLFLSLFLNAVVFFFFTDIPVPTAALQAFIPTFFISTMTLFFSVRLGSGLAAGMISAGLCAVLFIFSVEVNVKAYALFFNPYAMTFRSVDPEVYHLWMWQNRIGILVLALLFYHGALRGLDKRERLLK